MVVVVRRYVVPGTRDFQSRAARSVRIPSYTSTYETGGVLRSSRTIENALTAANGIALPVTIG
jgi:hypothetical protein